MNADHSPEIRLLQLVCTTDVPVEKKEQLTRFLSEYKLDWDRLYRLADRHRLTPFLYQSLQSLPNVPDSLVAALRTSYQVAAADNMIKLHQYRLLDKLLTDNGIAHIAFKGIYLAEHCYPVGSLRISGDLDVLVRVEDAFRTIELLRANQYELNQKHTLYYQDGEQRLLTELSEVSLFKPFFNNNYFDVDLHWKLLCFNKDYASFALDDLLAQTDYQTEVQVILLVTHHGVTNIWQQLYYINDLYFLLKDKDINWSWLLAEMRRYGMEQIFLVGLYWCQQIWKLPVPASVQTLVDAESVRQLAARYEKNWEADEPLAFSKLVLSQMAYFSKAQTQFGKRLRIFTTFGTSRVFRASTFKVGKQLIYVPKELGFVTVFVRAMRSLSRFFPATRSA
ncbi:nucleotidyltransferase family protein [Spirosoma sp. RP8]|uniref:Nucleotidyltransferase family protein n=1 Tax=Spirosoma liriopis TaxID=2937440 RepID=A0ABT0HPP7_9BACT|nr:nucleotidyltransferase family protein [Spirosoma liriopis]MCK8493628.1 nucleotidyltransferase family protein [Spirosoma liriopis]